MRNERGLRSGQVCTECCLARPIRSRKVCETDADCPQCYSCDSIPKVHSPSRGESDAECGPGMTCNTCAQCEPVVGAGSSCETDGLRSCAQCLDGLCLPQNQECGTDFNCLGSNFCEEDACGGTICKPASSNPVEQDLCESTGGTRSEFICGHKLCDEELGCSKLIPVANAESKNFGPRKF